MTTPLKIERKKRGIAREDLAIAVGVRAPTISRIENATKKPSPALAFKIAEFFDNDVTRDQILFPEEYPEASARKPAHATRQLQAAG